MLRPLSLAALTAVFFSISTASIACTCISAPTDQERRRMLRDMSEVSFDGQVLHTEVTDAQIGAVEAIVKVVRVHKGNASGFLILKTQLMGSMCGAADELEAARQDRRVLEFAVYQNRYESKLGEGLLISLCGLLPSATDPQP